jgi:ubiquinone/menaquinone biosynthesis C-methylase UbiE
VSGVRQAYDASGEAWRSGPERAYRRLAEALLDHAPVPLAGARVLDVGAGTGVAGRVAAERGAVLVVVSDLAAGMLRASALTDRVVADAQVLPFADHSFDLVVQNFVLGHLPDAAAALAEARRVGGALVASAFAADWDHAAKRIVDEVMTEVGFTVPEWYVGIKATEDLVADPESLTRLAREAGFADVEVHRVEVRTGVDEPQDMVDWRFGMAHLSPFVARLDPEVRRQVHARAVAAVAGLPPVLVPMLVLGAH